MALSISRFDKYPPCQEFVSRSNRDMPPTDYMLKIESFSLVSKAMDNYLSNSFQAGGYKWRLSIYPNGNEKANEDGYISVYLMFAEPDVLENGLAIDVNFKLFVYNHIQKNFVVFEYANEQTKKFHKLKRAHGIQYLMPTTEFCDASVGQYLVNDSCTFGVEVFVTKKMTTKAVCLSKVHMPKNDYFIIRAHTWTINNFSKRKNKVYYSDSFMAGGRKWRLLIYPTRRDSKCLAVGVELADTNSMFGFNKWLKKASNHQKVYATFALVVHDQTDSDVNTSFRKDCWGIFSEASTCKVNKTFMDLKDLHNPSRAFLLHDVLIIEAVINHLYFDKHI